MTGLQKLAEISERNLPLTCDRASPLMTDGTVGPTLELRDLLARDQRVRDAPPSLEARLQMRRVVADIVTTPRRRGVAGHVLEEIRVHGS